ncbi:hypothetical protein [Streptomyces sp. NPDC001068]|uniref:hypothetical protein n=1 Tax=Streptomyces sp. NPDC001068 TaxID=3364544 RepID=UPI0036AD8978
MRVAEEADAWEGRRAEPLAITGRAVTVDLALMPLIMEVRGARPGLRRVLELTGADALFRRTLPALPPAAA